MKSQSQSAVSAPQATEPKRAMRSALQEAAISRMRSRLASTMDLRPMRVIVPGAVYAARGTSNGLCYR